MKTKFFHMLAQLLIGLSILTLLTPNMQQIAWGSDLPGVVAYVSPNQTTGDEIHLIDPDGSNDRLLFSTGDPYPVELTQILNLAWKPNASELAFSSAHEDTCSLYETDIYSIRPDGTNYRRVTAPPACGSRAGLPTGTVTVSIINGSNTMGPFVIYFEGAPAPTSITLPPGDTVDVTFHNVVDYGAEPQYAVWMYGGVRSTYPTGKADVLPGSSVRTGQMLITTGFSYWGFRWPTYKPDGSKIASMFGRFSLYEFDSSSLVLGWNGFPIQFDLELGGSYFAWGPTPAVKDLFLYDGAWQDTDFNLHDSLFLGNVNDSKGQWLFDIDPSDDGNILLGLAWLPDGSGFLYSLKEFINESWDEGANIWEYSFATGESKRLTDVPHGFTRQMTVSVDGSKIVFEYQSTGDWIDANPPIDLWMMNRNGSGQTLFVENGRSPAWSRQDPPQLKVLDQKILLPVMLRR